VLDERKQHFNHCGFANFAIVFEKGMESSPEFLGAHQTLFVFNHLVHGLPHVVENTVVHFEKEHLLNNFKLLAIFFWIFFLP
jgi:hypothetical protein